MALTAARAKSAQTALITIFFIQAIVGLTYIPRIPELIKNINVDFATWGLIVGVSGMGALLGLLVTNRLISKYGTRQVVIFGGAFQSLFIGTFGLIHDPILFFIASAAMNFAGATVNIALNSQTVALQKALNKVVIGRFHGAWSIGAATSTALSAVLVTFMPLWAHMILIPGIGIASLFYFGRGLLLSSEDGHGDKRTVVNKIPFFKSPPQVWLLAAGLFTGVFAELALMDWSSVFAEKELGLSLGLAAIPFTAFSAAMILGRLAIGRLTVKRHLSELARIAGIFGSLSLVSAVVLGSMLKDTDETLALVVVSVLFVGVGLGCAPMVPSFFSAAGYVKGLNTAQALARMSLVNQLLIMAAKIAMGGLAQGVGLTIAFLLPTLTLFIAGVLAGFVAKRAKHHEAVTNAFPPTGAMGIIAE
ncbi:MFS transporter [Rhodoluna sp.]|uniref:MFS transporter n=1 Tax=Rhodoluna sp. TaxID=1969481 RepID=UPI0025E5B591|nr:MFS transporter [Rhodoluna sp.]